MTSKHWKEDRKERNELIKKIGKGTVVKRVEVDRHHKNGPEIHEISTTGIITIYNKRTNKMITQLIARVGQIKRYYTNENEIPKELLKTAREHQKMAYNMIQKKEARKGFFYWFQLAIDNCRCRTLTH